MFDLDDGAVDDVADAPRVNPALLAVDNEDVFESPVVEERDPPRDPVHPQTDLIRGVTSRERALVPNAM